jgi:hypothetical protein
LIQKVTIYIIIALGLLPAMAWAQVDSTATDSVAADSLPAAPIDTLITSRPDTLESDSVKVILKVRRWEFHAPLQSETAATDSSLRWQLWPDWTYKRNRDPGVISYRLGTIGRTNALQIDAHEPKYQQLYWENIRMNDPVSGIVNWSYMPRHRLENIYENDLGTTHRTTFRLKEYYLNEPLTRLIYDESSFNTRNLEFVVSQNFSQRTNAEIGYWDRRDGGEYDNSDVVGRQIYARLSHQLDDRQALKLKFLNNNYDNGLPFGYQIPGTDPRTFSFDRFIASAVESEGQENRGSTVLGLNYYRRPANTTQSASTLHAGLFMNSANREASYSADTTSYAVRRLGANVRKWLQAGPVALEGAASFEYAINRGDPGSSLETGNWGLIDSEAKAVLEPLPQLQLNARANYRMRTDSYSDFSFGAGAEIPLGRRLDLSAAFSSGTRMPTPQQLYWQSNEYLGNTQLKNEHIQSTNAALEFAPFSGSSIGIKGNLRQIEDGIRIGPDSTFANTNSYSSLSTAAYFNYNSTLFEFSGSATLQQFGSYLKSRAQPLPVDETERIWFKGGAYVKGYLFDRATYVKIGLSGMITPQAYFPARYYPSLDFWQSSDRDFVPSFNRLDVDLSARIRSILVLLRYENVLDDVSQRGYFETSGYPMTQRRFIFGFRVLLRN